MSDTDAAIVQLRGAGRALILSGSIGKGHDVVAEACAAALAEAGCGSAVVDCMALLGGAGSKAGDLFFRGLLGIPGAYDAFHFGHLRQGSRLSTLLDSTAARKLVGPVRRLISEHRAELVLSVFPTGAAAVDRLKPEFPGLRSVVYCTDACPHRLWVHPGTDMFLVTAEESAAFVNYHRPGAPVAVVPAAARPAFHRAPTKAQARSELGLPRHGRVVLLMAGSWGLAPLDSIAAALSGEGMHVLAVAGTNGKLERRLADLDRRDPRVASFGFTDRIPELMSAADLVITTAGDTCTEARVVGRPMLLLDTVPGHGRENIQLELTRGQAWATAAHPEVVAAAARRVLDGAVAPPLYRPPTEEEWDRTFLAALGPLGLRLEGEAAGGTRR